MGGHGGLNILPQKRWNVYNFDNREKVRKDEEAAARDEQLQRDEARKRDAQLRLDRLRTSRGLAPLKRSSPEAQNGKEEEEEEVSTEPKPEESEPKSGHINLFQGIKIFDVVQVPKNEEPTEEEDKSRKKMRKEAAAAARAAAKEAAAREVTADDEKYRLGYGVAGKGVKLPWYLERRKGEDVDENGDGWRGRVEDERKKKKKKNGKKSVEELREERMKREKREKERERVVLMEQNRKSGGFSRRR